MEYISFQRSCDKTEVLVTLLVHMMVVSSKTICDTEPWATLTVGFWGPPFSLEQRMDANCNYLYTRYLADIFWNMNKRSVSFQGKLGVSANNETLSCQGRDQNSGKPVPATGFLTIPEDWSREVGTGTVVTFWYCITKCLRIWKICPAWWTSIFQLTKARAHKLVQGWKPVNASHFNGFECNSKGEVRARALQIPCGA